MKDGRVLKKRRRRRREPLYQHRCRGKPQRKRSSRRILPWTRIRREADRKRWGWISGGPKGGGPAINLTHAGHGINNGRLPRRAMHGKKLDMAATHGKAIDRSHRVKPGTVPAGTERTGGSSGKTRSGIVTARSIHIKDGEIGPVLP